MTRNKRRDPRGSSPVAVVNGFLSGTAALYLVTGSAVVTAVLACLAVVLVVVPEVRHGRAR